MNIEKLFFELLQVAIGNKTTLSRRPSEKEWLKLFEMAQKQALLAIAFNGVTKLKKLNPTEFCIPNVVFMQWMSIMAHTVQRNQKVDAVCAKVTVMFQKKGFAPTVLKGQGNRMYYPEEMNLLRTPGDIDLWVDTDRERVIDALKPYLKTVEARIHHVEMGSVDGVPVEVHYWPMFLYSFRAQRIFEKWCVKERQYNIAVDEKFGFAYPEPYFNIVYQMVHVLRHLMEEGIGLRQLLDLYMNLKANFDTSRQKKRFMSRMQLMKVIEDLGMKRFTAAVMYVLWCVFEENLTDEKFFDWKMRWPWMLCKPDEKRGKLLLEEIMRAGNFGQWDDTKGEWKDKGRTQMFLWKWKRNWSIITLCPEDVLFGPFFRIWHYLWRRRNGYLGITK